MRLGTLTLLLLLAASSARAVTFVIRPDGSGDFPTIQTAIDVAEDGFIIELTDGTFLGPENHNLDFQGKSILVCSQSGNPEACIIDCDAQGDTLNTHRGVYFNAAETLDARLEGVTITGGFAISCCMEASGSGIYCGSGAMPTIDNCIVCGNVAVAYGAGLYCREYAAPTLTNCVFRGNHAWADGGGVYACQYSNPVLIDCTLDANWAWVHGGGLMAEDGNPTLIRCTITNNVGGMLYPGFGGGVCCFKMSSPSVEFCTFAWNSAVRGSGFYCGEDSWPTVTNTIIAFGGRGAAVECWAPSYVPEFTCSDIYGNLQGDWTSCIADQYGVNGNISVNPLFCTAENPSNPYALHSDSPCAAEHYPECGQVGAWPVMCGETVGREDTPWKEPARVVLLPGAPNPFDTKTRIRFRLPGSRHRRVELSLYDTTGRRIRTLIAAALPPGDHATEWDGTDAAGIRQPAGAYFSRLAVDGERIAQRLLLLRR